MQRRAVVLATVACLVATSLPASAQPEAVDATDAVSAAIAWSRYGVADGESRGTVLIARADRFPEALASGGVQGLADAPLLLTLPDGLDARVADEIRRIDAREAVLLGGEAALSDEVERDLQELGLSVARIFGDTRLTTATALARRYFPAPEAAVVVRAFGDDTDESRAFVDSLGAGLFAARLGAPVLLTETARLSAATRDYLRDTRPRTVFVVGGFAAVGQQARDDIKAVLGTDPVPVQGANRYGTSAAIGFYTPSPLRRPDLRPVVVDGAAPLAWAAGLPSAAHLEDGLILLVDGDRVPDEVAEELFRRPRFTGEDVLCAPFTPALGCARAEHVTTARDDTGVVARFDSFPDHQVLGLVRLPEGSAACLRNVEAPTGHTLDYHVGGPDGPLRLRWRPESGPASPICRFDLDETALDALFADPQEHVAIARGVPVMRRFGNDYRDVVSRPLERGYAAWPPS